MRSTNNYYIRYIPSEIEGRNVTGYAVVFDTVSEYIGFYETIKKGAITQETIKNSDVFVRFNHRDDAILARSKYGEGSLTLTVDDSGLKYEFISPNTQFGDELLEHIKRGEIDSSSFAFTISDAPNSEKWYKDSDGTLHREIYKIDYLGDVAPCFQPAYQATTCSARDKEKVNEIENIETAHNKLIEEILSM